MSLTCRVQYLNDIDPFSYTTNFPDPARPPLHTFSVTLPLINQLAAIHRLLKSPHRNSFLAVDQGYEMSQDLGGNLFSEFRLTKRLTWGQSLKGDQFSL
ncbi:hypothetical protein NQ318_016833 [Aromia moschata]|uniref:FHOD1 N-terminal GTPase-binding domain-containing protein n=1 Tax=Aromia moschata TaxID=1265417 RepID=A0AAV8YTW4_9CUCU|nr:hypothetical protein NQ318_016833 [Aromia moschata]